MVHTSQYLHWQTQTHSIPTNSNSLFTHCLRRNLGSEQNFQQFIGKFVVYHFYHIVLFCCIAKSIYSAIPYNVFVYDSCAHGNLTDFFCFLQALTVQQ